MLRRKKNIANFNRNDRRRPEKRIDPINERIRYPEVRVIGPEGQQLGVMSSRAANSLAMSYEMDLYCVAPNANPPVCKILDYGRFRFEQQKQERSQRKKSKGHEMKQVQLTPQIGQHDLETKAKKAREFIEEGDKVQVCVVFRGRQLAHKEVGEDVSKKFVEILSDIAQVEKPPYWEGKWYNTIIGPKKK